MNLKLRELIDAEQALGELVKKDLPAALAYKIGKLVRNAQNEYQVFYETRDKLVKKLGVQVENDWVIPQKDTEALGKFKEEIDSMLDMDVEIENFYPIPIQAFEEIRIRCAEGFG